jgi:hypothetical protein
VRGHAEADEARAEHHEHEKEEGAAARRGSHRDGHETEDPAHRARGVHHAEPFRPDVQHVTREAWQERLVREPEHLGARGERHEHGEDAVLAQRRDEVDDAPPQ